jgi:hypothetical protein
MKIRAMGTPRGRRRKLYIAISLGLLCLAGLALVAPALPALADEGDRPAVEQALSGYSGTASQVFSYALTPNSSGAPMPAGSVDGVYSFNISGTASYDILDLLAFDDLGRYVYTLKCTTQTDENCTVDPAVYTITVYKYTDYFHILITLPDDPGTKLAAMRFSHSYSYTPPAQPPASPPATPSASPSPSASPTPTETPPADTPPPEAPPSQAPPSAPPPTQAPPSEAPPPPADTPPADDGIRIEYDEDGVALGEWRWDPEKGEWVYMEYAPVKTGDDARTAVYIVSCSASLLSLALLLFGKRRRRRRA